MQSSFSPLTRLRRYQNVVEDFFVDSYGNTEIISKKLLEVVRRSQRDDIEHLASYMWWSTIEEVRTIFGDFAMERSSTKIRNRQRSYYSAIRYCMETVSDLEYLCKNPKELPQFMTDGEEIKQEIDRLRKSCTNNQELDMKINKLLVRGKINSRTTQRISEALPGCLRDYAMLCLYSHPSMEGFRLCCDEDGVFDLMFQNITYLTFRIFASYYRILVFLKMLDAETDECFSVIVYMILDCHRRIANIRSGYVKRAYRKKEIEELFRVVEMWAHESVLEDDIPISPSLGH